MKFRHSTAFAVAGLLTLAACGSSDDEAAPPPAPTNLVLSGTAAVGAAAANAPLSVKCASGTGTATTAANGSYTVTITEGAAPCVIEVTNGADKLYSMVEAGTASPATVNVTPLTTLLTWQVNGGDPAALYSNFDAAAQGKVTAAAVSAAVAQLAAALAGQVEIADLDPIKTPFAVGDATDQKLDALAAVLAAAQTDVAELGGALVANPGSAEPIKRALAPSAAGCKGLKSGAYRYIFGTDDGRFTLNATTLTITNPDDSTQTLTDNGACSFTTEASTVLVSPTGFGAVRQPLNFDETSTQFELGLVVPEQTLPLSELTGTWNYVTYIREVVGGTPGPFGPGHGTFTVNDAGVLTSGTNCEGLNNCIVEPESEPFTVNADGGFDLNGAAGGGVASRAYLFRTPAGVTVMVLRLVAGGADTESGFVVATKQVRTALPTNGLVTPFRQFSINANGLANAITSDVSTITSVDAAGGGSFTRTLSDGHPQTFQLNNPREGMRYRAAGSSLNSAGASVTFNEVVQLRVANMTFSLSVAPTQNFFNVSVDQPPAP